MFYINDYLHEGIPSHRQRGMMANINSNKTIIYQHVQRRIGASTVINNFISENLLRGKSIIHVNPDSHKRVPYATIAHSINFGRRYRTVSLSGARGNSLYGLKCDIAIIEDAIMTSEMAHIIETLMYRSNKLIITTSDRNYAPTSSKKYNYYNDTYNGTWFGP